MDSSRRKKKVNATGRNPDVVGSKDRTLQFRRSLWHSPQVAALSPSGRALMVELQSMYNGRNNGELFLSVTDAALRLGFSDRDAAMTAINEMLAVKLIEVTMGHLWKGRADHSKARAFNLNWIAPDGTWLAPDKLPPLDFATLTPKQKARIKRRSEALDRYLLEQRKRKSSGRETPPIMAMSVRQTRLEAAQSGRETLPNTEGNGAGAPGRESTPHIIYHIPDDELVGCNKVRTSA